MSGPGASAMAVESERVRKTLLANRHEYATSLLTIENWSDMWAILEKFRPDFVICAARKMPRLVTLLRDLHPDRFHFPAQFVSDFAIGFMRDEIKNARVLIIDDAVNVGSTVNNIYHRVNECGPNAVKGVAVFNKKGGGSGLSVPGLVEYVRPESISDHEYMGAATRLSKSLLALNRPLEVEFPLFQIKNLSGLSKADVERRAAQTGRNTICHALNISEASYIGLQRFSIEFDPKKKLNEKVRLYLDAANQELILVPMAYVSNKEGDKENRVRNRFLASMRLGHDFIAAAFPEYKATFLKDEAAILLGEKEAAKMEVAWVRREFGPVQQELVSHTPFANDWPEIKKLFKRHEDEYDRRFLNDCFTLFFVTAAEFYGSERDTDYERLCKGPAFLELYTSLFEMWEIESENKAALLSQRLGALLDEHIDNGFVVPMTDKEGNRIFRKGEPYPYGRSAVEVLRYIYGEIDPEENIYDVIKNLSPGERQRFERIMLSLEC